MSTEQELFKQADTLFDTWDFEGASALYRKLALDGKLLTSSLTNLEESWMFAHLKFLDEVSSKFPESLGVIKLKIHFFIKNNLNYRAVSLCTGLLDRNLEQIDVAEIRSMRFHASVQMNDASYLLEDFTHIWDWYNLHKPRLKILETLLKITDPKMADAIRTLVEQSDLTERINQLLIEKVENLQKLDKIADLSN